jgi:exodeoxyribonuclease VII small subunit
MDDQTSATPAADPTFEAALARLEEILAHIEGDELELDESLALFEEGVQLLRAAERVLGGAEARVRQLLSADEDGTAHFEDFEVDA